LTGSRACAREPVIPPNGTVIQLIFIKSTITVPTLLKRDSIDNLMIKLGTLPVFTKLQPWKDMLPIFLPVVSTINPKSHCLPQKSAKK